jgi:predicted nucleic acid-binding protein
VTVTSEVMLEERLAGLFGVVEPDLQLVSYGDRVREEAERMSRTYVRDHRLSFFDAISFAVVTSLLNHIPCFTFDEDFRRLGLAVLP